MGTLRRGTISQNNPEFGKNYQDVNSYLESGDVDQIVKPPSMLPLNINSKDANKSVNIAFPSSALMSHPLILSPVSPSFSKSREDSSPSLDSNLLKNTPKININTEVGPLNFQKFKRIKKIYQRIVSDRSNYNKSATARKLADSILKGRQR